MRLSCISLGVYAALLTGSGLCQTSPSPAQRFGSSIADLVPQPPQTVPLYAGEIPGSKATTDEETKLSFGGAIEKVSRPTMTVYLPGKAKSNGSSIIIFPGGGYVMESYEMEGTSIAEAFQDRGVAALLIKYRLPNDATMVDKSIGPLQDAQRAIQMARENASKWNIDPGKIGVIGFSAGGHLASTVGTHFDKALIPNTGNTSLRPDFMVLVYPVISMASQLTHQGSRDALLGKNPAASLVQLFSNDQQVTERTPPALLLHATDDLLVDVDNSVAFYEALHHHNVPAGMILFPKGNHGFFGIARDEWMEPVFTWMLKNGWMKP
jgi:acetyl esterase/lipase